MALRFRLTDIPALECESPRAPRLDRAQGRDPRYIRLLNDDLPLIEAGLLAAGEPILAEDRIRHRIPRTIAECFRRKPDFFLRVEGNSMDRLGFLNFSGIFRRWLPLAAPFRNSGKMSLIL